MCSVYLAKY